MGTWYERRGRLSLSEVALDYVSFGLRLAGAGPIERSDLDELLAAALAFEDAS